MSYFAQKNYQEQLGSGTYTIAEAGCLLTSISNLLMKWGIMITPPSLNTWFKEHNDFIGPDNLSWNSISQFDPLIHFQESGNGPMPPSPDAIVKFHYQSIQTPFLLIDGKEVPNMIDHFCAVDRIVDGQVYIIDSWDGLIKAPAQYQSAYHPPIAWATYVKTVPAPAPAAAPAASKPAPPAAPVPLPTPVEAYVVIKPIPGYMTSNQAANHINSNSTVPAGRYAVYSKQAGMVNITRTAGRPGWWINSADNTDTPTPPPAAPVVPAPAAASAVHDEAAQTAPAPAASKPQDPPNWRSSYSPHQASYYALSDMVVHDLAGQRPDVMLHRYDVVPVAGTFIGPDGVLYARSETSVKNYWWYGIPMNVLMLEDELFSTSVDTATRQVTHTMTTRDHLVVAVGKLAGWLERWNSKNKVRR